MFYIVDENNTFMRPHPRWGSPDGLHMEDAIYHAANFKTQREADEMLAYWDRNNRFETGRVVTRSEAARIATTALGNA